MSPTPKKLLCLGPHGFYQIAYVRWDGPWSTRPVVCVHGLTRNSRDFDPLARALAATGPVVAPDMPGRGESDWLSVPADYGYPVYLNTVATLIASLDVPEVDYVGTSMGGIIGMLLAAQPGSPIRRMVINDVGPIVPKASLERIGTYVGKSRGFATVGELEQYLRVLHASFGPLTDAQWRHLAAYGHRVLPDGQFTLKYDPAIALPFQGELRDANLWPFYDQIKCPTLVIRGGVSDLLPAETAEAMTQRGPKARLHIVPDVGHAPALMADDQIAVIRQFLAG